MKNIFTKIKNWWKSKDIYNQVSVSINGEPIWLEYDEAPGVGKKFTLGVRPDHQGMVKEFVDKYNNNNEAEKVWTGNWIPGVDIPGTSVKELVWLLPQIPEIKEALGGRVIKEVEYAPMASINIVAVAPDLGNDQSGN